MTFNILKLQDYSYYQRSFVRILTVNDPVGLKHSKMKEEEDEDSVKFFETSNKEV